MPANWRAFPLAPTATVLRHITVRSCWVAVFLEVVDTEGFLRLLDVGQMAGLASGHSFLARHLEESRVHFPLLQHGRLLGLAQIDRRHHVRRRLEYAGRGGQSLGLFVSRQHAMPSQWFAQPTTAWPAKFHASASTAPVHRRLTEKDHRRQESAAKSGIPWLFERTLGQGRDAIRRAKWAFRSRHNRRRHRCR
jgi:hypothetical protein